MLSPDIEMSEEMAYAIGETNACNFTIYEISVTEIVVDRDRLLITFEFYADGEQMDDKMFSGTRIGGEGIAVLDTEGELQLEEIGAARVDDYFDEEF